MELRKTLAAGLAQNGSILGQGICAKLGQIATYSIPSLRFRISGGVTSGLSQYSRTRRVKPRNVVSLTASIISLKIAARGFFEKGFRAEFDSQWSKSSRSERLEDTALCLLRAG